MKWIRRNISTFLFFIAILAATAVYGIARYGTLPSFVAALRGHLVHVSPSDHFVGEVEPGERTELAVTVRNLSGRQLRLLGSHSSCSCTTTTRLPVTLEAGELQEVGVAIVAPNQGSFGSTVVLITDVMDLQPEIRLTGNVRAK